MCCVLCWCANGIAQQPSGFLDLSVGAGHLIPIYDPFPKSSVCTSFEVRHFQTKWIGPSWRSNYHRTRLGWSAQLLDLGNPKVLGQAISIAPIAEHVKRLNDRSTLHVGMAIGLGVFTRRHDALDNPTNNVIGSRMANVSRFTLEWRKQIRPQWRMGLGLHFIHSSNAHFTVPNVGANIVGAHVSLSKNHLPPTKDHHMILLLIGYNRRWNIHAGAGYGWHEFTGTARPTDGPLFRDPTAHIQVGRVHRHRSSLYLGAQWVDCRSHRHFLLTNELVNGSELRKKTQNYIVYMGYDWFFPHFSFFVQMGYNVYHPSLNLIQTMEPDVQKGWLYRNTSSKLGYRVYLFDPIRHNSWLSPYLQVAVKTNGGTANFLETTLGFKLDR